MYFLFVVGVEGSGHHMMSALLRDCLRRADFDKEGPWHNALRRLWTSERWAKEAELRGYFGELAAAAREKNVTHLYEGASFPFDQPRNALRRPDILSLVDAAVSAWDLRMIVLWRDPVLCTNSGLRRGFSANIIQQAKIVEDNLLFIKSQLGQVGESLYRVMSYDGFLSNPQSYVDSLSEWFALPKEYVLNGLKRMQSPRDRGAIPEEVRVVLEDYFSVRRCGQWDDFFSSNTLMASESGL